MHFASLSMPSRPTAVRSPIRWVTYILAQTWPPSRRTRLICRLLCGGLRFCLIGADGMLTVIAIAERAARVDWAQLAVIPPFPDRPVQRRSCR
jgi:hypothetical protein